jgi:hypothetical protein
MCDFGWAAYIEHVPVTNPEVKPWYSGAAQGAGGLPSAESAPQLRIATIEHEIAAGRMPPVKRLTIDFISMLSFCVRIPCYPLFSAMYLEPFRFGLTSHISSGVPYPRPWARVETAYGFRSFQLH